MPEKWLKTLNAACEADGIEQSSLTKQLVTWTLPWETIEVSKVSITFVWRMKPLSATRSGPVEALIAKGFWLVSVLGILSVESNTAARTHFLSNTRGKVNKERRV